MVGRKVQRNFLGNHFFLALCLLRCISSMTDRRSRLHRTRRECILLQRKGKFYGRRWCNAVCASRRFFLLANFDAFFASFCAVCKQAGLAAFWRLFRHARPFWGRAVEKCHKNEFLIGFARARALPGGASHKWSFWSINCHLSAGVSSATAVKS